MAAPRYWLKSDLTVVFLSLLCLRGRRRTYRTHVEPEKYRILSLQNGIRLSVETDSAGITNALPGVLSLGMAEK